MKKNLIGVAIAMALATQAHAALVTLSSPAWPPVGSSGLENVQFNVGTGVATGTLTAPSPVMVALGAHPYKNGATMPNDGISIFTAPLGSYMAEDRANWSFDFAYSAGACLTCTVLLEMDSNPGVGITMVNFGAQPVTGASGDSWNMRMNLLETLMSNTTFDPNTGGQYDFRMTMFDGQGQNAVMLATTAITVITGDGAQVSEPQSLALLGISAVGLGLFGRKKKPSKEAQIA
jgi:hypothetical protein